LAYTAKGAEKAMRDFMDRKKKKSSKRKKRKKQQEKQMMTVQQPQYEIKTVTLYFFVLIFN